MFSGHSYNQDHIAFLTCCILTKHLKEIVGEQRTRELLAPYHHYGVYGKLPVLKRLIRAELHLPDPIIAPDAHLDNPQSEEL